MSKKDDEGAEHKAFERAAEDPTESLEASSTTNKFVDSKIVDQLFDAILKNDSSAVSKLCRAHPMIVNSWGSNGATPLEVALGENNIKMVKKLLSKGANPDLKNQSGLSPLWLATQLNAPEKNKIAMAEILLKAGADINLIHNVPMILYRRFYSQPMGATALHGAIVHEQEELMYFLVRQGAKGDVSKTKDPKKLLLEKIDWINSNRFMNHGGLMNRK